MVVNFYMFGPLLKHMVGINVEMQNYHYIFICWISILILGGTFLPT